MNQNFTTATPTQTWTEAAQRVYSGMDQGYDQAAKDWLLTNYGPAQYKNTLGYQQALTRLGQAGDGSRAGLAAAAGSDRMRGQIWEALRGLASQAMDTGPGTGEGAASVLTALRGLTPQRGAVAGDSYGQVESAANARDNAMAGNVFNAIASSRANQQLRAAQAAQAAQQQMNALNSMAGLAQQQQGQEQEASANAYRYTALNEQARQANQQAAMAAQQNALANRLNWAKLAQEQQQYGGNLGLNYAKLGQDASQYLGNLGYNLEKLAQDQQQYGGNLKLNQEKVDIDKKRAEADINNYKWQNQREDRLNLQNAITAVQNGQVTPQQAELVFGLPQGAASTLAPFAGNVAKNDLLDADNLNQLAIINKRMAENPRGWFTGMSKEEEAFWNRTKAILEESAKNPTMVYDSYQGKWIPRTNVGAPALPTAMGRPTATGKPTLRWENGKIVSQ